MILCSMMTFTASKILLKKIVKYLIFLNNYKHLTMLIILLLLIIKLLTISDKKFYQLQINVIDAS